MRILAVAQRLDQFAAEGAVVGRAVVQRIGEPVGDRRVIGGGARVGFRRELLAQLKRGHAVMQSELGQHLFVVGRLHHHGHVAMVFGGGADHGRAADVDVLDAIVEGGAFGDGGLERIEVHDQEIDRLDAVLVRRRGVLLVRADRQQPAMHLRVQRLHPAVHHFRKAGEFGDVDYL